jgi:hypothetical protein
MFAETRQLENGWSVSAQGRVPAAALQVYRLQV